jgi:hypothetical protein
MRGLLCPPNQTSRSSRVPRWLYFTMPIEWRNNWLDQRPFRCPTVQTDCQGEVDPKRPTRRPKENPTEIWSRKFVADPWLGVIYLEDAEIMETERDAPLCVYWSHDGDEEGEGEVCRGRSEGGHEVCVSRDGPKTICLGRGEELIPEAVDRHNR